VGDSGISFTASSIASNERGPRVGRKRSRDPEVGVWKRPPLEAAERVVVDDLAEVSHLELVGALFDRGHGLLAGPGDQFLFVVGSREPTELADLVEIQDSGLEGIGKSREALESVGRVEPPLGPVGGHP
jgi:hypothetical protein